MENKKYLTIAWVVPSIAIFTYQIYKALITGVIRAPHDALAASYARDPFNYIILLSMYVVVIIVLVFILATVIRRSGDKLSNIQLMHIVYSFGAIVIFEYQIYGALASGKIRSLKGTITASHVHDPMTYFFWLGVYAFCIIVAIAYILITTIGKKDDES